MKLLSVFLLFVLTSIGFTEPVNPMQPDKFTMTAQAVNDKIKCCGKLKRQIVFAHGGEVILSYNERFNFFYMVPFTGKDKLVKIFKDTSKYDGSISVYENAANEFKVTFKIADEQYVVVSRFEKKEDALQLYKDLLLMRALSKKY
jgi:CRISPR/Cas system-associated protein Csx1